jgi:cyclopropane fatty-acyl-phospholipid synthase-like methyltransferase
VNDDPRRIVANGYDVIAERYLEWTGEALSPGREHALAQIGAHVAAGARVLDLGCGAGVPMTRELARTYAVHGVDISAHQIELARKLVPSATFECADFGELEVGDASYDAVVAFFSLTHLERDELPALLSRVRRWLTPRGVFVAAFGVSDDAGTVDEEWLGAPMFFSHFDAATNEQLVARTGFDILQSRIVTEPEDGHPADFLWITARPAATP